MNIAITRSQNHTSLGQSAFSRMATFEANDPLDAVTESIEAYEIRRVKWAAALLDRRGESVGRWKVIRMAGLRPDPSEKVERAIEHEVCISSGSRLVKRSIQTFHLEIAPVESLTEDNVSLTHQK